MSSTHTQKKSKKATTTVLKREFDGKLPFVHAKHDHGRS